MERGNAQDGHKNLCRPGTGRPYKETGIRIEYNAMNGNTIYDIYIDEEQRIWMANYPIGITVRNNRYNDYKWIKHSIGNKQSLINDQVNAIIEDEEGDLWFATNNGISLYEHRTKQWHSFLSVFNTDHKNQSHTFISLCEISPGIIWAGGYSSGIYQINKKQYSVDCFTPASFVRISTSVPLLKTAKVISGPAGIITLKR